MPAEQAGGTIACVLCGGTSSLLCDKRPATYFRCNRCGFIVQHPPPPPDAFASYAETEYQGGLYAEYVRAREMKLEHFRRRLTIVQSHCQSGRLLDIGCSCGYFLEVAAAAGFDVHGLEFSASAIAAAAPAVRSRIRRVRVEDLTTGDGAFDVISAFDIIEHLTEPVEFLRRTRTLLSNNGWLVISTPDARHWLRPLMRSRWPMLQPMQHVSLFTGEALTRALTQAGYRHITIGPAFKVLSIDYLIGQLPTLNPRLYTLARAATRVLPHAVRHRWRTINIGEILATATV